ncbi:MAG: AAA family ATPase, partial [Chloroflexota bacterium]
LERIARGRMVGRNKEFQDVRSIWKKTVSGKGQSLLISGEPGIGKTRLTRETETHAEVSGGCALVGASYSEGGAPYAAFGQIIRQVFSNDSTPKTDIPEYVMADILTFVPDLQPRFPDISPNPKLEAKQEQQRIFENITGFFRLLSTMQPLLLVVEDVHWSDSGTLLLLLHLARNIKEDAIMLMANYREVELDEDHPFHQVLLDINREHLATRIKLARLTQDQTSELLTSMFDDDATPNFLESIFHETEGNPFFVEEVCKALVESGKLYYEDGEWHRPSMDELEVPQSIRIAIQARVRKLPEEYQAVLNLAAVLGHEFDFELILAANPQDEEALIDALEAAEKAQLIRANPKDGPNAFAFVHALIPSTIYESINTLRRGRLHKRVAQAIKSLHPNDFEELAYHYTGAGDLENAVDYYRQAAQRAKNLYAFDAAIQHLQSAIDLLEPGEHEDARFELLEQLGDVRSAFGEKIEAIGCYILAKDKLSDQSPDQMMTTLRMHRKIIKTGISITFYNDFQKIQPEYEASISAGLNIIQDQPAHTEIVLFLSIIANDAVRRRVPLDFELGAKYALQAVEIAEHPNAADAKSIALGGLSFAYESLGKYDQVVRISEQRLELLQAQENKDPSDHINAYTQLGYGLAAIGDYREALNHLINAENMASEHKAVGQQVVSMIWQAFCNFQLDHWDEVLSIEEKWRALVQRYPNFIKRAKGMCFQIGLAAAVFALKGNFEQAALLRKESHDIMVGFDGPPERWGTSNYI